MLLQKKIKKQEEKASNSYRTPRVSQLPSPLQLRPLQIGKAERLSLRAPRAVAEGQHDLQLELMCFLPNRPAELANLTNRHRLCRRKAILPFIFKHPVHPIDVEKTPRAYLLFVKHIPLFFLK